MQVKYTDFMVGRGRVTIREVGEAPEQPDTPNKPETTQPNKPQPQTTGAGTPNVSPSKAKPANEDEDNLSDAGILNDRAIELPKPEYPAAAKKDRISGQVQVRVVLDATGKVVSAEAVFGPEQLRAAAVEAAKRARFKPILVFGEPQKVFGILLYDFVP